MRSSRKALAEVTCDVMADVDMNSVSPARDAGIQRRNRKRGTEEARQVILEAALVLLEENSYDFPSLERVAEIAGVHKMTIYRTFGSREALANACAEWLCDYELSMWRQSAARCQVGPGCKIPALFDILVRQLLDRSQAECRLHMLVRHFRDSSEAIRSTLNRRRREQRSLFLLLAEQAYVHEPTALADALCLLWEGAAVPWRTREESVRLALALPSVVARLIASHTI